MSSMDNYTKKKDQAIAGFLDTCTAILKSLQPVIEHAVKEYLSQRRSK